MPHKRLVQVHDALHKLDASNFASSKYLCFFLVVIQIWELGLDTTRNRIIQMDLLLNLGTLSLAV